MSIFLKYLEVSWLKIFLLTLCVVRTFCFNIKTDYFVTHRGPFDSAFGFSLAQHKDADGYWVLVGAPEAETPNFEVSKGGAVYKCHTSYEDLCDRIPFDTKGNHHDGSQYIDDKSHQWFGASVVSRSGIAVACAPRYVWYSVKKNRREPIGKCFVLTNQKGSGKFKEYSPCMTNAWGYHRQGNCQAGFGVALSQGGTRLYVGAVGSWYWQGQVFYQNLLNMQEKLTTSEAPKQFDMSYMGFSLCMGNFDGDTEEDVAVGVPRGSSLKGMVVLFNHKLEVLYNITGDQIGSYFGYSIAVLDYDGDGLDDVVVGSPWHTQKGNPSSLYEEGSVSLFKHTLQHNFRRTQKLFGRRSRSHFGLSLASLKDLNGDGFEDLAVGAPRDGEDQKGGVYIFLGGPSGLIEKPAQTIFAEDLAKPTISSFGWALSGGLDLDQNEYPDLAVGAHESNNVIIFRTRPIVSVDASVKIKSESGVFDLESLSCSLQNNTDVPCYPVHYCFSYTGKGVPPEISLFYSLQLDTASGEHLSRLFFLRNEGQATFNSSILLHKDVSKCKSQYIYAAPFLHDKLTPLVSKLSFSLDPVTDSGDSLSYDSTELRPVLAPPPFGQESFVKDVIYFQNNCGDDNICIPNLRSQISINDSNYVLGSRKKIIVNTRVFNKGEDSYGTRAHIEMPSGVHFNKFVVTYNGAQDDVTPFCTTSTKVSYSTTEREKSDENEDVGEDDNNQESENEVNGLKNGTSSIICELGNPLPSKAGIGLQLHFQPSSQIMSFPFLKFDFKSNSTNDERNSTLRDNTATISLPVVMESDVNIRGISWPDTDFNYNASSFGKGLLGSKIPIRHEKEAGPEVTHIYDVVNRGPSDLPNVRLYLLWPTRTLVGDPLLYLTETPIVSPNSIRCEPVLDVNYLDLKIDSPSQEPLPNVNFLKSEKWKSRTKRRLSEEENKIEILLENQDSKPEIKNDKFQQLLSCGSTNCTVMKCFTPLLKANDNFIVRVRSRLWVNTIEKLGISDLKISSRLVVHSTANWKTTYEDDRTWSENVVSAIKTRPEAPTSSLPWLIWLGSTLLGLLVLALLILLLWMLGFFKRRRPRDESENELINRNGTNSRH